MEVQSSLFYSRKVVISGVFGFNQDAPASSGSQVMPRPGFLDGDPRSKGLAKLIERIDPSLADDRVDWSAAPALKLTALEIVARINKKLRTDPIEVEPAQAVEANAGTTPEEAASFVLDGVKSLFEKFRIANPQLGEEQLATKFFSLVRSGVEQGYGDAVSELKSRKLLESEGVQDRVAKTKSLIDDGINQFEQTLRDAFGVSGKVATTTNSALLDVGSSSEDGAKEATPRSLSLVA